MRFAATLFAVLCTLISTGHAGSDHIHSAHQPTAHAPIGVMGDHMHKEGEWMVSYRLMQMNMQGNRQGDRAISTEKIATTAPNSFFGLADMPPTLRVVPTKMTTDMHMLGMMYAPSDNITLMAMLNYISNSMNHLSFQGGAGTNVLARFSTESSGLGDTKLAALIGMYEQDGHKVHANLSVSLPTGAIDKTDTVTAPNGATPTLRIPYAMQLGSGTYDIEPGITYTGSDNALSWGAQVKLVIRLGENNEDYRLGNKQTLSSWLAYRWSDAFSLSSRLTFTDLDSISGQDANIVAPVQTADPDNYGGDSVDLAIGANFVVQAGHRLALEYERRIEQDVNGIQMEMDDMLTLGYQYAF